jgi:hypothetical protein
LRGAFDNRGTAATEQGNADPLRKVKSASPPSRFPPASCTASGPSTVSGITLEIRPLPAGRRYQPV